MTCPHFDYSFTRVFSHSISAYFQGEDLARLSLTEGLKDKRNPWGSRHALDAHASPVPGPGELS